MKLKSKTIELQYGERILAVVPERCAGPGWVNSPIWVYIGNNDRTFREECIQPNERNAELNALFDVGCVINRSLIAALSIRQVKEDAA